MKKMIILAVLTLSLSAPAVVFAGNGYSGNGSAGTTQQPEECSVDDLQLTSTPAGHVEVVGCSGQIEGNDSTSNTWLENENVWDDNGVLTNINGGATTQSWTHLTKYAPNGNVENGQPNIDNIFTVSFSDCINNDGDAVACDGDATALTINIDFNTTAADLLYNQFVFSAKGGGYYSLYQVQVLEGIESITGSLTLVSHFGLSHLTVFGSNLTRTPQVEVNAPATAALLLTGIIALSLRRKRAS